METPRIKALKSLANQLPVANQQLASQHQAARDIQVQNMVRKAPSSTSASTAQETGAAVATNAGAQAIARAENQAKQGQQIGQLALGEQTLASEQKVTDLRSGAREQEMNNVQRLASLSESAKRELYDQQMQFQKDQNGRVIFNEKQIQDAARLTARSDEEYNNFAQQSDQLHQRKIQVLEATQAILEEQIQQGFAQDGQKLDQNNAIEVQRIRDDIAKKIAKAKAKKSNNKAAWTTGGTIVGGVVGGVFGGPAGAVVGASVGGAVGGAVGEQVG